MLADKMFGSHKNLLSAVNSMNREMQEQGTAEKAKIFGLPYINLYTFPIDLNVLGLFTETEARESESVPFYGDGQDLRIGTMNPKNPLLQEKINELLVKHKVNLYVISKSSFEKTMGFYGKVVTPKAARDETVVVDSTREFESVAAALKDETVQTQKSATELIGDIFGISMYLHASDIHVEPEEHRVKVRFRIDGVLQDLIHINQSLRRSLTSRIKILSKLKLNVEN